MSEEPDPLRSVFDEIRASMLPSIRPPGVEQLAVMVRRRRTVRSSVATAAVVLLGGLGFWAMGTHTHPHDPPGTVATATTTSPLPSPSPAPSISGVPSPEVLVGSSGHPTHGPSGTATSAKKKDCVTDGVSVPGVGPHEVEFSSVTRVQTPPCAGYRLTVYWATYTRNADGTGTLYASGTTYLDVNHLDRDVHVSAPATCRTVFIGHNWSSTPATVAADVMDGSYDQSAGRPFWDHKHGQNGLNVYDQAPCPSSST